ncbi:hypothetical protein B4166_2884 [Caldibacillus thermoamylovorans]|uniref:HTH araC/xylS-type domain-containing protein n=1 Tax=Caldibacillus thermoamylovorans TaxID=35841 RepID=A0ABD4A784_9BACI|nr:hypothetical protein B4166_2884 [Caldibacillus thermoamylovorans]KIO72786.1 hypothetical protein B4167_2728 [Caldibacillus thermoamylovorans]
MLVYFLHNHIIIDLVKVAKTKIWQNVNFGDAQPISYFFFKFYRKEIATYRAPKPPESIR